MVMAKLVNFATRLEPREERFDRRFARAAGADAHAIVADALNVEAAVFESATRDARRERARIRLFDDRRFRIFWRD
jgi:hypothetical protein